MLTNRVTTLYYPRSPSSSLSISLSWYSSRLLKHHTHSLRLTPIADQFIYGGRRGGDFILHLTRKSNYTCRPAMSGDYYCSPPIARGNNLWLRIQQKRERPRSFALVESQLFFFFLLLMCVTREITRGWNITVCNTVFLVSYIHVPHQQSKRLLYAEVNWIYLLGLIADNWGQVERCIYFICLSLSLCAVSNDPEFNV